MSTTNSVLLEQMGLTGLDIGYLVIGMGVVIVLLLIMIVLLIVQMRKAGKLKKRLDAFTTGKDGKSLEESIASLFEDNQFLKDSVEKNRKDIRMLFKKMETTYQKMGLVKYDAFSQMGGQLSFCLAMLDENNNGFILNSVHSTEGCYSYTKEIKNGESALSLGKEETEALAIAVGEEN
jgi:Na+-transporting methylmalonyl-CoA/oxaloacetate decarboxylase gamma subunit